MPFILHEYDIFFKTVSARSRCPVNMFVLGAKLEEGVSRYWRCLSLNNLVKYALLRSLLFPFVLGFQPRRSPRSVVFIRQLKTSLPSCGISEMYSFRALFYLLMERSRLSSCNREQIAIRVLLFFIQYLLHTNNQANNQAWHWQVFLQQTWDLKKQPPILRRSSSWAKKQIIWSNRSSRIPSGAPLLIHSRGVHGGGGDYVYRLSSVLSTLWLVVGERWLNRREMVERISALKSHSQNSNPISFSWCSGLENLLRPLPDDAGEVSRYRKFIIIFFPQKS